MLLFGLKCRIFGGGGWDERSYPSHSVEHHVYIVELIHSVIMGFVAIFCGGCFITQSVCLYNFFYKNVLFQHEIKSSGFFEKENAYAAGPWEVWDVRLETPFLKLKSCIILQKDETKKSTFKLKCYQMKK